MARPDVTVSIVNADDRELLLQCLRSLERGSRGGLEMEVVVLDNASEDGSVDAVREHFPQVRVIARPFRAGFGANHNAVLDETSGRYAFLLNSDTTSDDWGLDRMIAHLDARPRVGALGPRLVYPDGRPQASAWRFPTPAVAALGAVTLGRAGIVQSLGPGTRSVDWLTAAALLLRRSALDEVGSFDEGFFMFSEETDLCRRLHAAGYDVQWFPSVTVVHHVGHSTAHVRERRINEMWRSRHRYWRKHHSRLGGRAAALLTGWQYAARAGVAAALLRLPARYRPLPVGGADAAEYALHARDALGVRGPGLRELAEEWNGRVGAAAR